MEELRKRKRPLGFQSSTLLKPPKGFCRTFWGELPAALLDEENYVILKKITT
jgi:hypothetical protein